ncbi:MAG TPA: hypothetical protein VF712_06840 [Thermoleophilaceae bacterium]|jgi:hypothetical protein
MRGLGPLRTGEVHARSRLAAPRAEVWEHIVSPEGINDELRPFLRMSVPRGFEGLDADGFEVGKPLGRSWILLFGAIPVECDDITVARLDAGSGFLERSKMLSQRLWEHERTIEDDGDGCVLSDRMRFEPRLPIPAAWNRPLVRLLLRHRHRRLRRRFGGHSL